MSTADLMADLTRLGIDVGAEGDRIWYRPRSAVKPDLIDRMREHKAELLVMLRPNAQRVQPATVRCPWCSGAALVDADGGLACKACGRLAWIDLPDGGMVRADRCDDDLVVTDPLPTRRWQRWETDCGCGAQYRTTTFTREQTIRVTCANCQTVLGGRPLAELSVGDRTDSPMMNAMPTDDHCDTGGNSMR